MEDFKSVQVFNADEYGAIRFIVWENEFIPNQEDPVKSIRDIIEITIDADFDKRTKNAVSLVQTMFGELTIVDESKFDLGKARKFSSKLFKIAQQVAGV